jgi:hypothetical protein
VGAVEPSASPEQVELGERLERLGESLAVAVIVPSSTVVLAASARLVARELPDAVFRGACEAHVVVAVD